MKYKIALQKTEEGISVSVPGLPGCWSQGDTEAEAIDNIVDAIKDYLIVAEKIFVNCEIIPFIFLTYFPIQNNNQQR
jgi:predicted RNase H-like HicB family nuclease